MASRSPPGHACPALFGSVAFLSEKVVGETQRETRERAPGAGRGATRDGVLGPWGGVDVRPVWAVGRPDGTRHAPAPRPPRGIAAPRLGSRLTRPGPVC